MKGKKYHARLTETERKRLRETTRKGSRPARQIIRANILLCLDENGTERPLAGQKATARQRGCKTALACRVGEQYEREGIEGGGG
jgi:hypothetical protein